MKIKYMLLIFVSILCLSIGYSASNTELSISGDAVVKADAEIKITNIEATSYTNSYVTYNPSYTNQTVTMSSTLGTWYSSITYEVTIVNSSTVNDYIITDILELSNTNTNVTYVINDLAVDDIIEAGTTKTFTISINSTSGSDEINELLIEVDWEIYNPDEFYGDPGEVTKTVGLISKDYDFSFSSYSYNSVSDIEKDLATYSSIDTSSSDLGDYYLVYKISCNMGDNTIDTFTFTDTLGDGLSFVTDLSGTYSYNKYDYGPVIAIILYETYSGGYEYSYIYDNYNGADLTASIEGNQLIIKYSSTSTSVTNLEFDVYYLVEVTDIDAYTTSSLSNNVTAKSNNTYVDGSLILDTSDTAVVTVTSSTNNENEEEEKEKTEE